MFNKNCVLKPSRSVRFLFIAIIFIFSVWVQAVPVDSLKAEKAVKGWLKTNCKPLETPLPDDIASVEVYTDQAGDIQYFVVNLRPEGYVVVAADDNRRRGTGNHVGIRVKFRDMAKQVAVGDDDKMPGLGISGRGSLHRGTQNLGN